MKVSVRDFDVDMVLANNGITMQVYDNDGKYRGKLRIGRGTVEWCHGKTPIGNGVKVSWDAFIKQFEEA